MDHHEAVRKFEQLMLKEADHAHEVATELEALAPMLTTENSRQLAHLRTSPWANLETLWGGYYSRLSSSSIIVDFCATH